MGWEDLRSSLICFKPRLARQVRSGCSLTNIVSVVLEFVFVLIVVWILYLSLFYCICICIYESGIKEKTKDPEIKNKFNRL